ncbi:alpha-ribazole phosphatase/probable phosphoglycerate mutase [Pedobacter sp. AK017]|uniref:histidine phosphatase family protein n=1 Tax=Pedobacter sp. AK017 TaxID=2723073 RepID=UPI001622A865|nr:histidine phosphatase family protein [Pedobacter sp. AK017]MBB5440054.1 alpha-ribazole phosphatase/probable phosphoglycerate mutase [Pedobacter sp. AK017]
MLNVYLLRHGETQYNADGNRYCGRTDINLTAKGMSQANLVYEQLKGMSFDAIYASPLKRALYTAEIASGVKTVQTDARLIEVDFGNWEGKTKEEFIAEHAGLWDSWMEDPAVAKAGGTGESAAEVVARVDDFYQELLRKHPSGNVLVVGHNGINRLYLAHKLGMPLKHYRRIVQENSSITLFSLDEGGELNLKLLNSRIK